MRVFIIFSLLLAVFCAPSLPAIACSPNIDAIPGFDEQLAQTPVAFIGTVETIENGAVYIRVEKGIKGVDDGDLYETQQGQSTCDIFFQPGQHWLYMGSSAALSGSRLIEDEYGRSNGDTPAFIKEKFGYDSTARESLIGGTISESCAPWDGAAIAINLDNHVKIAVFTAIESLEKQYGVVSYQATAEMMQKSGGASIALCDEAGGNCRIGYGMVSIGHIDAESAAGRVDVKTDEEHTTTHVFRVKRIESNPLCG